MLYKLCGGWKYELEKKSVFQQNFAMKNSKQKLGEKVQLIHTHTIYLNTCQLLNIYLKIDLCFNLWLKLHRINY